MSSVEQGNVSAVETGQMSAAETRQMYSIKTRQRPVAIVDICLVSAQDKHLYSRLALPALELAEFWPGTRGILRHCMVSGLHCGASPTTRSGQDDGS